LNDAPEVSGSSLRSEEASVDDEREVVEQLVVAEPEVDSASVSASSAHCSASARNRSSMLAK